MGRLPLISLLSSSALRSSSHKLDVLLVDALIHREATELTTADDDVARLELGSHVCGARSRGFCQNQTQIVPEHGDGMEQSLHSILIRLDALTGMYG